jgi:exosome complex component CSL4
MFKQPMEMKYMSKKTPQSISGLFVSPGEKLGVIEEYIPGQGIYVEDGTLFSSITGRVTYDKTKRELHITPGTHQLSIPQVGDIVFGEVSNVQDKTLTVKIMKIRNSRLSTPLTGIMHISDVSRGYVKTMRDLFKPRDFIRAKVISTKNREVHLTTQNRELGVFQAFCVQCGNNLILEKTRFKCTKCNKMEKRKIAYS